MALITVKIERHAPEAGAPRTRRLKRRGVTALVGVGALVGAFVVGSGTASAGVISITPKVIASNVVLASGVTEPLVVSGGTTTIPTQATRVVLSATVTNATGNGNLKAFPASSPTLGTGILHYTTGGTATGTFTEAPGTSNKVTFIHSANTITLSVSIIGYTTDVTASDVAPDGGTAGQVLTNTGTGAAWQPEGHAYAESDSFTVQSLTTSLTTVASVTVPAGSYAVSFDTTIAGSSSSTPDNVGCFIFSTDGSEASAAYGNTYATDDQSTIAGQTLVSTSAGGTITAECVDSDSTASVFYPSLIATAVGATDGAVATARAHHARVTGASVTHR